MNNILQLPEDIVSEIHLYIPIKILSLCNKDYWRENYNKEISENPLNRTYYRFLIRNDYYFIFRYYFQYYFKIFLKKKKIKYKTFIFNSYLDLLRYITLSEYNSQRCNNEIINYCTLNCLTKKKYKKIKISINKWSN